MNELTRYDPVARQVGPYGWAADMEAFPDGEYYRADDVDAALAQVEAETWENVANEIQLVVNQGPLETDYQLVLDWSRQQAQRAKERKG